MSVMLVMWAWSAVGPDDSVRVQGGFTGGYDGTNGSGPQFIVYKTRMQAKILYACTTRRPERPQVRRTGRGWTCALLRRSSWMGEAC